MNPMSHRWPKTAVRLAKKTTFTAVAAALLTLSAPTVQALSLGPIVVQSALGEPLRAEIDILEINAEESASLRAAVASPEAFRAAGLDYNAAMANLRVTLQRRANGRSFIRINSDRPVNDPFVDMILEASWSSGRIVRDYTMLFDPPNLRGTAVAAAPVTAPAVQEATTPPATVATTPAPAARPATAGPRAAAAPKAAAATKSTAPTKAGEGQITVKPGDTASKIALATKPANVSLDQMLVALLRANPDAFINSNLNRIKSGAVLNVPTAEQASALGAKEATQTVIAQSRDFGDFRKKLAGVAPTAQVATADRQSGGSVQTKVEDKKPGAAAPDKLTLSKGAVAAQANADKLAKELAAKEAAATKAATAKINADLTKLGAASAPVASGTPAAPAAGASAAGAKPAAAVTPVVVAAVATPAPAAVSAVTPAPPAAPATVASAAAASAAVAAKPASSAPAKPVAKAPMAPPPEPSLIDQLTENPLVPAAGAGLVALLAGFGVYRARQRKKAQEMDSAFLESRLQPDSFFGASGGQKVDTQDSQQGVGSSMVYTPSQLDAADDVDPVAEADVYLAYGRDVQAEEILKEALKTNAGRIAIHQKLLEIYAKRRDTRNFELAANEAFKICNGEGPEWTRICDQGLGIDPSNPLYMPGGKPQIAVGIPSQPASLEMLNAAAAAAPVGVSTMPLAATASAAAVAGLATVALSANSFNATTSSMSAQPAQASSVDLDFDLDFSLDEDNAQVISDLGGAEQTSKMRAMDSGPAPLDMNFDMPTSPSTVSSPMTPPTKAAPLEFDLPGITGLSNSGEVSRPAPLMPSFAPSGGLSLAPATVDLEEFKQQAAVSFGTTVAGPLATFAPKAPAPAAPTPGLMEFDLGSLSLDLEDSTPAGKDHTSPTPITASTPLEDPLATKLSLAEEFNSIGDHDGARALIEEVLLEATGEVKTKAQQALAKMS